MQIQLCGTCHAQWRSKRYVLLHKTKGWQMFNTWQTFTSLSLQQRPIHAMTDANHTELLTFSLYMMLIVCPHSSLIVSDSEINLVHLTDLGVRIRGI